MERFREAIDKMRIYKDEVWGNLDSLYVKPKFEIE